MDVDVEPHIGAAQNGEARSRCVRPQVRVLDPFQSLCFNLSDRQNSANFSSNDEMCDSSCSWLDAQRNSSKLNQHNL